MVESVKYFEVQWFDPSHQLWTKSRNSKRFWDIEEANALLTQEKNYWYTTMPIRIIEIHESVVVETTGNKPDPRKKK